MKKSVLFLLMAGLAIFLPGSCSQLDVVAKGAVVSFDILVKSSGVKWNAESSGDKPALELTSAGGEIFTIAPGFAGNPADFTVVINAEPFIASGLDPAKLPSNYVYTPDAKLLKISFDLGDRELSGDVKKGPTELFAGLVKSYRDEIGYHEDLDHYGIKLGNGNMFEWARDPAQNDKDIVFILNPEPFLKAGTDPAKVIGWVFAKIKVKEPDGRIIQPDKFLKPYNIQ